MERWSCEEVLISAALGVQVPAIFAGIEIDVGVAVVMVAALVPD
jgi:hypothetical protein